MDVSEGCEGAWASSKPHVPGGRHARLLGGANVLHEAGEALGGRVAAAAAAWPVHGGTRGVRGEAPPCAQLGTAFVEFWCSWLLMFWTAG